MASSFALGETLTATALNRAFDAKADNSFTLTGATTDRVLKSRFSPAPEDFGAAGDGATDDTTAVQDWVTYCATNHVIGRARAVTYKLTAAIVGPRTYGWGIVGEGREATIFKQYTANTPVFTFGDATASNMHSVTLTDFQIAYSASQSGNTSAVCILFAKEAYQWTIQRISFDGGYWGISFGTSVPGAWGQNWGDLWFRNQYGGAIDYTNSVNACPNNTWGRIYVDAINCVDAVFKGIRGYNFVVGALEIVRLTNVQMMTTQSGAYITIGSLKVEGITYNGSLPTGSSGALILTPTNGWLSIDQTFVVGTTCILTPSAAGYLFGGNCYGLRLGIVDLAPSAAVTNFYLSAVAGAVQMEVKPNFETANTCPLTNVGSSVAANSLTVSASANTKLSDDKGDADYTFASGDPCRVLFQTALTAIRTVNIPSSANDLFNGLAITVISEGAVNGANTILVKSGGVLKYTLNADNKFVTLTWRRNPTATSGWVVTQVGATA